MTIKDLQTLPKLSDSLSYLYLEHTIIQKSQQGVESVDKNGTLAIPCANLTVLMLGPGTSISHAAIARLAEYGCAIVWVGQEGNKYYAHGLGETRKATNLLRQAHAVCNPAKHIQVVLRMYEFRFGRKLADDLSLEQIRGMEGARVRNLYQHTADRFGIQWHGRNYNRTDWQSSDPVNRALSAANALLNGLCHAAIVSGGYNPGLGFVHTGKQLSFVYDIADLYKAEITIPTAFQTVATLKGDYQKLESTIRTKCREKIRQSKLLERILPDINKLLQFEQDEDFEQNDTLESDLAEPTTWWNNPN